MANFIHHKVFSLFVRELKFYNSKNSFYLLVILIISANFIKLDFDNSFITDNSTLFKKMAYDRAFIVCLFITITKGNEITSGLIKNLISNYINRRFYLISFWTYSFFAIFISFLITIIFINLFITSLGLKGTLFFLLPYILQSLIYISIILVILTLTRSRWKTVLIFFILNATEKLISFKLSTIGIETSSFLPFSMIEYYFQNNSFLSLLIAPLYLIVFNAISFFILNKKNLY